MTTSPAPEPNDKPDAELAAQADREGAHPFALGQQAAREGKTLTTNPFPRRSQNALAFKRGWDAVTAEKAQAAAKENGGAEAEAGAADPPSDEAPAAKSPKTHRAPRQRAEQQPLPGTEGFIPHYDADVHQAAKDYAEARDARMAYNKLESECKEKLLGLLSAKGLDGYRYEEVEVELTTDVKLKVRVREDEDGEE